MESYKRDYFIARIRAGYVPVKIGDNRFKVEHPSVDVILESHELYIQSYEEALNDDMLTEDELLSFLIIQNMWSEKMEKEYQEVVPGHIEYWKKELYRSLLKSKTKETVRKYLEAAKQEYNRLSEIRHQYDYVTVEGYANYIRSMFLISKCTTLNNKVVDWEDYNLMVIMTKYHTELLKPDDIRILARTSPWTSLWPILKSGNLFEEPTTEQQSLITWSNMYDKIYESPDCPSEEVISDDDMLDGWLLIQKEKRDQDRKQEEVKNSLNPRIANADEVFVPAQTVEDAKKIDILNTQRGHAVKQNRLKHIKEKGIVKQQEFADIKQKLRMDMQQAYSKQIRNK